MKSKHKIKVTYSNNMHQYVITLYSLRTFWFFQWYAPERERSGTYRDIAHYKDAWMADYGLSEEQFEDCTI